MMVRTKKIFLGVFLVAVLVYLIAYGGIPTRSSPKENSISLYLDLQIITVQQNTNTADMYLLTVHTSFVDNPVHTYRHFVQSNFLRMSNFSCFPWTGKVCSTHK